MKIVVVSDSHGFYGNLEKILLKENPDCFVFCGDGLKDILEFCDKYPDKICHIVSGNCDRIDNFPLFKHIDICGKQFYITHGHNECVKSGYMTLAMRALSMETDIILFGHTHVPLYTEYQGMLIMNPGSAAVGSYGVLELDEKNGRTEGCLKMLNQ